MSKVPAFVRWSNPITRRLLGAGMPMGPNGVLTVRGRKSGVARSTPVAVVEVGPRRWVLGAYGEVNWVRNLREAGEGTIEVGRKSQPISAVELNPEQAAAFFKDVLRPFYNRLSFPLRLGLRQLLREMLEHPDAAATRYPVFELHPTSVARS